MDKNTYSKSEKTDENVTVENKQKTGRRALRGILAGVIALVCFLGGALTGWLILEPEMRSLIRLKARMDLSYYQDVSDEDFYGAIFDAVNDQVLDDYSWYMTKEEYAESKSSGQGNRNGLGLQFLTKTDLDQPQMLVVRVSGNSPAERAGLLEGDCVVGFGATSNTVTDCVEFDAFSSFVDECENGQSIVLKITRDTQTRFIELTKEDYVENYVFYRTQTSAWRFTGAEAQTLTEEGEGLPALPQDAAYIRLTQFNGGASGQFASAMRLFKTQGKTNLVLDLRGNGGGYLDVMKEIAGYFCKTSTDKKPVVAYADDGNTRDRYKASANLYHEYFSADSRICVLADSTSASASECLIGCMLDYKAISYQDVCLIERDGVAKTYGKGIMQTTYRLALVEGDAVKLTTAKICWPLSGTCIHGRGILPQDGVKTVAESAQRDAELGFAINALFS